MNDSLVDLSTGIEATTELARYLDEVGDDWAKGNAELLGIYSAMRGNAEGWYRCFLTLQMKGNALGVALVQLGSILNEMTKRAGVASRRNVVRVPLKYSFTTATSLPSSSNTFTQQSAPLPISRFSQIIVDNKPLPQDPDAVGEAAAVAMPKKRDANPFEDKFENPRKQPQPPSRQQAVETIPEYAEARHEPPHLRRVWIPESSTAKQSRKSTGSNGAGRISLDLQRGNVDPPDRLSSIKRSLSLKRSGSVRESSSGEKEDKPQRPTNKLRKKSTDALTNSTLPKPPSDAQSKAEPEASPGFPDSAYSSGSERPNTSQTAPLARSSAKLDLFPSHRPLTLSSLSVRQNAPRESAPSPTVAIRRETGPGQVRKSSSFGFLRKLFSRKPPSSSKTLLSSSSTTALPRPGTRGMASVHEGY
ncbi:hypothetical protein LTS18_007186 [Coniosporium uncinatum]|uniref:Uncharacterized protein n=1 Tax=Coniosporium uncinatum TaxID=93489 RepID=A0ACC3D3F0_9PEZI|nr:hypothetical protein LTS18_007186 [Coniosporium uncinatum]